MSIQRTTEHQKSKEQPWCTSMHDRTIHKSDDLHLIPTANKRKFNNLPCIDMHQRTPDKSDHI